MCLSFSCIDAISVRLLHIKWNTEAIKLHAVRMQVIKKHFKVHVPFPSPEEDAIE